MKLDYRALLDLVKQLPVSELTQLMQDLGKEVEERKNELQNSHPSDFQNLLLSGPVMGDDQYQQFLDNRITFNTWRTK